MTTQPSGAERRIVLDLPHSGRLFSLDDADPRSPGYDCINGMEHLLEAVSGFRDLGRGGARIVLRLGAGGGEADEAAQIEAAIERYCVAHAQDRHRVALVKRREGLQTAMLAAVFVAFMVGLSFAVESADLLPPFSQNLIVSGLVVAGWVAVWRPLDLLLFEPWLLRREARILRAIAGMPVSVELAGER